MPSITNTQHLEIGSNREWSVEQKLEWIISEPSGKRPLFGFDLPITEENGAVLDTISIMAEFPANNFGAYAISIATASSDVLEFLKFQSYHQTSLALRKGLKLAARFYSPSLDPSQFGQEGKLKVHPTLVLDKHMEKKHNHVQWTNLRMENITRVNYIVPKAQFLVFDPWGQGSFHGGGIVMSSRDIETVGEGGKELGELKVGLGISIEKIRVIGNTKLEGLSHLPDGPNEQLGSLTQSGEGIRSATSDGPNEQLGSLTQSGEGIRPAAPRGNRLKIE